MIVTKQPGKRRGAGGERANRQLGSLLLQPTHKPAGSGEVLVIIPRSRCRHVLSL